MDAIRYVLDTLDADDVATVRTRAAAARLEVLKLEAAKLREIGGEADSLAIEIERELGHAFAVADERVNDEPSRPRRPVRDQPQA